MDLLTVVGWFLVLLPFLYVALWIAGAHNRDIRCLFRPHAWGNRFMFEREKPPGPGVWLRCDRCKTFRQVDSPRYYR